MTLDPNTDPFAPPPGLMPPPPPQQNFMNLPPLPPQPPVTGNGWNGGNNWNGGSGWNGGNGGYQPWNGYNIVNSPAHSSPGHDINQPIPPDAAAAGSAYSSSSVPEQEFEQEGGAGGSGTGGMDGGQMYNPPPAFGVQSKSYYGSQPTSLLDAYYRTGRPQSYNVHSYNNNNNGFFGGLFGNSPGGNMLGALMMNEFIF
ncbi:hypothetical protein PoB_006435700 [Plakobranchus ocellatus]|uniref:Uncharacterized protein n=1 Tax=Plakobranchus ocellatus TaxID=259542 RepID=A0AAV4D0W5_9GAST|nr:hypothetical protein PoB_006435700 [Plakobranchus ocellatus]